MIGNGAPERVQTLCKCAQCGAAWIARFGVAGACKRCGSAAATLYARASNAESRPRAA